MDVFTKSLVTVIYMFIKPGATFFLSLRYHLHFARDPLMLHAHAQVLRMYVRLEYHLYQ